jgi:hypothetical protein
VLVLSFDACILPQIARIARHSRADGEPVMGTERSSDASV